MDEQVGKQAKLKALRLLEQMDRTEVQLRRKLKEKGFPEEAVDEAVAYVKSYHYLDDARYAAAYIELKSRTKSRRQIEQGLLQKGIDRQMIADALEDFGKIDESAQIEALIRKKGLDWEHAEPKEIQKLCQSLMRRGFSYQDIRSVIDKYTRNYYNEF